jgi:CheY-like chemotaxis protein
VIEMMTNSKSEVSHSVLKFLVVDDEIDLRDFLIDEVKSLFVDATTHSAGDGIEAIQFLRENQVDILMTDLRMPRMDGMELIRQVQALPQSQRPKKILLVSAYIPEGHEPPEGVEVFHKPLDFDEFRTRLVSASGA